MTTATLHPLPDALVELVAHRFRLLGEPSRIRLLDRLRDGEASVGVLAASLGATQQNVSKHLGALHREGLVDRRKVGNHTFYAIADQSVFSLCETVCGGIRTQRALVSALLDPPEASR